MRLGDLLVKTSNALEHRVWFVATGILFRICLEYSYVVFLTRYFEYAGFTYYFEVFKYVESWLIYLALLFLAPFKLSRPSDFLIAYLLFAFLAPLLVFYSFADQSRPFLYITLSGVIVLERFRHGRTMRFRRVKGGVNIALLLLTSGSAIVTIWMLYSGGLSFFNLELSRVYEFREDVGNLINIGPMAYLNVWAPQVFGPALIAWALWRRKYYLVIAIYALHILWFGISSHKAVLFNPLLVVFVWLWFRRTSSLALLPIGLGAAVLSAMLFHLAQNDIVVPSLLIRRALFVPSHLTFAYFDFFSQNQFVYWSFTITSAFIEYPYVDNPAKLIGNFLGTDAHANNSFLSAGYMHAGIAGILGYCVVASFLLRVVDSLAANDVPMWLAVAILIVPSRALLISADLPTALLTHGLLFAIILLWLMKTKTNAPELNIGHPQPRLT